MCWLQLAEGKMKLLGPPAFFYWLQLAGGEMEVCFRLGGGSISPLKMGYHCLYFGGSSGCLWYG